MASLDQESLFSLELVTDSLSLVKKVPCRFPALAFRLLDFPTLIIYHIEPDLGEAIKRKIKLETNLHVPEQLTDLKDKNGVYQVKKGKSCLFKVPPNVLLSHLQNTPLYVMVIDTYPGTPKLVGNCTVPLDMTMNDVYNDIKKLGLSVPTSHGEKGTYKVFNLMGEDIGQVTFGFRILSLGVGLISHIPDTSVVKMKKTGFVKKSQSTTQAAQKPMEQEATEIILQDLETADENIQVVLSTPRPVQSMNETQTELTMQQVASTQTVSEVKKKKLQKEKKRINRVDTLTTLAQITPPSDDIIITNTVCPPALFYNSAADPPHIAPGLTLDDYLVHKQRERMKGESDTESIDSNETIREEDRFSDSDFKILEKPKPTVKTVSEFPPPEPKKQPKKPSKPVVSLGAMAEFPLLSALMSEIVAIHGGAAPGTSGLTAATPRQRKIQSSPSLGDASSSASKKTLRPVSPTRTFMLRKAMATALQAKPLEQNEQITSQMEISSQQPSPKQQKEEEKQKQLQRPHSAHRPSSVKPKGSTKQRPHSAKPSKSSLAGGSSTHLLPGMTKSQRLRLSKTNPHLLEKLEKEEKERVENFKAKRKAMGVGFYSIDKSVDSKHQVDKEHYDKYSRKVPKSHKHKKPVPTPRTSVVDDQIVVREVPTVTPRKSKHKKVKEEEKYDDYYDEEYDTAPSEQENTLSSHSSPSRVIDVHLPSTQMDDTASTLDEIDRPSNRNLGKTYSSGPAQYSEDFEDDHIIKQRQKHQKKPSNRNLGKTFSHSQKSVYSTEPINVQYSQDDDIKVSEVVEGIDPGETLGLKRMVDTYSDDEDGLNTEGIDAGEALGLQKMVDNFSDNNNAAVGIDAGEALGLRQITDTYSDDYDDDDDDDENFSSNSQVFHSAKSDDSVESVKSKPKLKVATSTVRTIAPSTSDMSPSLATKPNLASRNPMTESISTVDDSNPDSTAYIHRSEMTNSQFSSMESTGQGALEFKSARKNARYPLISPRKSLDRVHTESVSSYAPSDPDLAPLSPTAEYSDNFESASEDEYEENIKYMRDARVVPEARFGYTWSGGN